MTIVRPKFGDEPPRTYYADGMRREDWELLVFDRAELFTVIRKVGPAKLNRREFARLPDAMKDTIYRQDGKWRYEVNAMIYAVAPDGMSFCIPPKQWKFYLKRWEANHASLSAH